MEPKAKGQDAVRQVLCCVLLGLGKMVWMTRWRRTKLRRGIRRLLGNIDRGTSRHCAFRSFQVGSLPALYDFAGLVLLQRQLVRQGQSCLFAFFDLGGCSRAHLNFYNDHGSRTQRVSGALPVSFRPSTLLVAGAAEQARF